MDDEVVDLEDGEVNKEAMCLSLDL